MPPPWLEFRPPAPTAPIRLTSDRVSVHDPLQLPPDLPVPEDDGAADHLTGLALPPLRLPASTGGELDLASLAGGLLVLFVYPAMGRPGVDTPPGWDATPGARGCTPQGCAFRDLVGEFGAFGAQVAGLSAQAHDEQVEAAERLHLPYPLLSDPDMRVGEALGLPTFALAGRIYYKRLALVAEGGAIGKVFYPVFPPDRNASDVLRWLGERERR